MNSSLNSIENVVGNHVSYFEQEVELEVDPLTLSACLAECGLSDTFISYEDHGQWSIAIGEAATVVAGDQQTKLKMHGQVQHFQSDSVIESTEMAFAALPMDDWRAYGIVNFSLARKNYGLDINDDEKELMRFFVPVYEILINGNRALLRAIDQKKLAELSNLFCDMQSSITFKNGDPFSMRINEGRLDVAAVEDCGANDYHDNVAKAVAEIGEKRYSKVILSRAIPLATSIDIVASYICGRRANTPARSFLIKLNGLEVSGFSPETVLKVDREGWVSTRPLAGTRSIGSNPEEERRLRSELLSDCKEVYEHAISVQMAVTELKKICVSGTVVVSDFMDIVRRTSVQHIVSNVRGRLADGESAWQALQALFPGVTATGVPKKQAIDAIGRLESGSRHLYSGCVVMLDSAGAMDAAIVLRSVFQKNGRANLRVGAGVVANSSPAREMEETREKVRSVARYLISSD